MPLTPCLDVLAYTGWYVHGRSGSVALPRMKLMPAIPAGFELVVAARSAERAADVRRRLVDMMNKILDRVVDFNWTGGKHIKKVTCFVMMLYVTLAFALRHGSSSGVSSQLQPY